LDTLDEGNASFLPSTLKRRHWSVKYVVTLTEGGQSLSEAIGKGALTSHASFRRVQFESSNLEPEVQELSNFRFPLSLSLLIYSLLKFTPSF
jgi:hypothetical protein